MYFKYLALFLVTFRSFPKILVKLREKAPGSPAWVGNPVTDTTAGKQQKQQERMRNVSATVERKHAR